MTGLGGILHYRPEANARTRGRCDFIDFMPLPSDAERRFAVRTDTRGEVTDPAAASVMGDA